MSRPVVHINQHLSSQGKDVGEEDLLDFRKPNAKYDDTFHERRKIREKIPSTFTTKIQYGVFWSVDPLPARHQERLQFLLPYFHEQRLQQIVAPLIGVTAAFSLRKVDWSVINFAKKHKITLLTPAGNLVNIYEDYRSWLKYWKRPLFDAFRRGQRVYFEMENQTYSTTVAQLNFLYFAEQTGILHFSFKNRQEIERDMIQRINFCKMEKNKRIAQGEKRKRSELSQSPLVKCQIYHNPCTVTFHQNKRSSK